LNPVLYYVATTEPVTEWVAQAFHDPFSLHRHKWDAIGLGPIVAGVGGNATVIPFPNGGPDGRPGIMLVVWPVGQTADRLGYFPGQQVWRQVRPDIYVGWDKPGPPRPDDIDNGNPYQVAGPGVRLGDGQIWTIPEIRNRSGHNLPTDLYRDLTGKLVTPVKAPFAALWEEACFFFDLFWQNVVEGDHSSGIPYERGLTFCSAVLGLRYRFCDLTQDGLRLIDSTNLETVIGHAIGWPEVYSELQRFVGEASEREKKNRSAESVPGNCGPPD
jgi:hypothetical protein